LLLVARAPSPAYANRNAGVALAPLNLP